MLIAVDVDGTLYDGAVVAPAALASLRGARSDGHHIVIASGRRWPSLLEIVPEVVALCGVVVAEEGAVLVDVESGSERLLGPAVDAHMVRELQSAGVAPLDIGRAVVGAAATHEEAFAAVHRRFGTTRRIVRNKASVALVPRGCDKGRGVRRAAALLGCDDEPILAIGDAQNDLSMFAVARYAVAVANADQAVMDAGILRMGGAFGDGVAEAIDAFVPSGPRH